MDDEMQPLVTFALLGYNQESYIREAIKGAFAQTYGRLEIILSDDGSKDSTFSEMQILADGYDGPHQVIVRRSDPNQGFASHVNAVAALASGQIVVLAAGDDVSLPGRVSAIVEEWVKIEGGTAAFYSDFQPIDYDGRPSTSESIVAAPPSLIEAAQGRLNVLGATSAYTRDVFTRFPALSGEVKHEDRVLPFRALLIGGNIRFVDKKLVSYRVVGGVSRDRPSSSNHFLRAYTAERHSRFSRDASQRLADARHAKSPETVVKECVRTVAHHRAMIHLASSKPFSYELITAAGLFRGARRAPLLKHYLKMRMSKAFSLLRPFA